MREHVPKVAYNKFNKDFEEPVLSEGYACVEEVDSAGQLAFSDFKERELFLQYT